jgi:branched-subunit amino acid transport protein AzlD
MVIGWFIARTDARSGYQKLICSGYAPNFVRIIVRRSNYAITTVLDCLCYTPVHKLRSGIGVAHIAKIVIVQAGENRYGKILMF